MSRRIPVVVAGVGLAFGAACEKPDAGLEPYRPAVREAKKDYGRPLPPGELALRKIDPEDYPDFSAGYHDRAGLEQAVHYSLEYLAKPSSQRYFPYGAISHGQAVASLQAFLEVLREVRSPQELDSAIRRRFDVYQSIGCDDRGTVYFTGYYCPIFDGRKQADATFRYPLYRQPPDLVKDEEGRALGRRVEGGGLVPYYTRRQIEEQHLLRGLEIGWLKDPFEAYVATVQGSAKLRLPGGTLYEIGYAANNGHEYTPIAERMIADGAFSRDELSLQTMMRYFRSHPEQVAQYCRLNPRYVFFREAPGGPYGSINTPVTAYRTLATDKEVFPRACLAFITTRLPAWLDEQVHQVPHAGFALDQDTGGAIRAAGRCDVYMGIGPQAEALAGRTGAEGALYYLFVRPEPEVAGVR